MASGSMILEQQVASIKNELKTWEKEFNITNGRKPGRDDIKRDATISAKYREYDRLRRPTSFAKPVETPKKQRQVRPESAHKRSALRERNGNALVATPNKARKTLEIVQEEEPEVEATPAFIRCALGPTPQKDGQVLGIFDMGPTATPSKSVSKPAIPDISKISDSPSKPMSAPASTEQALSATPRSSSKRRFLDAFAGTPLKRKREDDGHTPSTARRQYTTPSFLRRSFPLAPIEEESAAGAPPFKKKRGLVRSLSALIQGLRKNEDKRMDDDWDIMEELEAEERGEAPKPAAPRVLVEDSQVVEMPLGPDGGLGSGEEDEDSDAEVALGADGKPRKPWKKKGLKRQTKRVKMRPVLHKPKKASELEAVEEDDEEEVVVAETQLMEPPNEADVDGEEAEASGNDDEASDYDDNNEPKTTSKATKAPKPDKERPKPTIEPLKPGDPGYERARKLKAADEARDYDAAQDKPKKKLKAQPHANFRALKIKNKNSKASGKGGRRFGRR